MPEIRNMQTTQAAKNYSTTAHRPDLGLIQCFTTSASTVCIGQTVDLFLYFLVFIVFCPFPVRVSILTRDIDIANLSVCLTVCPLRSGIV